ncbi:hypothetical protein GOP47_0002858 [Adiantum capillus-veneris]|uniref:YTH domain-containing protein n=1 Tax=Adiantum capillus-veneris TaxID=13818 RepID=A0A9D4VAV8_ADICA|nr:hypothetical protein GOP47_0002858 [Adiantum capillus-veneris]
MAIPLGKPVEEITYGLEGIKIDSHARAPQKAGKLENGPALSPPDVASVQAHLVGHEHTGGEMTVRTCCSEASAIEQGNLGHPRGIVHSGAENPMMDQGHPGVEHIALAPEQFAQYPYVGMPQVPLQGSIHTGYPAPIVNFSGYYPYSMDGGAYNSPFVDYTPVYSQNYYYSAPGAAQYSIGYSVPYGYPQYQLAPVEQYNATAMNPPLNEDGAMVPDVQFQDPAAFAAYGYQPMNPNVGHGQWVPVAMVAPPTTGDVVPNFNLVSFPDPCAPGLLNAQPAAWIPQPEGLKGLNDGEEFKLGLQQPNDAGLQNDRTSDVQKNDTRVPTIDNKKHMKKQPNVFYGPPMPIKGSWVRSGHFNYMNAAHPLKAFNSKIKSSGMCVSSAEPHVRAEVNLENFSLDFEDAKHFVIKSFSEENVARSIQHGVWASTPNGNKKLDEAFQDSQVRAAGKAKGCPIFLYFSVNGSGRFCGVAEMVGAVDYNNTMDFWERNRWCGSFPVRWHFIKDVPHSQLRRIILPNNENKPVTSSRDTQEVNFEQGLQMLSIIKNYSTKASILDNFPSPHAVALVDASMEQPPPMESRDGANSMVDKKEVQPDSNGTVLEKSNALRASNCEAKARDTQLQGKPKSDATPSQGVTVESGGRNADKENVMVSNVSTAVAA